ncbi:MAG: ACP S-malonyltransferase [Deltaproteobacteria bacterium]|jgi:[acyl-carrier-protein] S-malonyltransferase|nr:ACP S-malonyltransferase [Deltaproteobacteria bacterium]
MTITAFIFPGQGGQFVGQGREWAKNDPGSARLFQLADQASGRPIGRLSLEGPLEELSRTENLQPAVLAVGLAAARQLRLRGVEPAFAAGHSLGEYGALALAGVISEEKAFALVARRSELMAMAAEGAGGSMSAILGLAPEMVEAVCELARHEGQVVAANFNSPQQTVISGEARAVAAAVRFAGLKGGKAVPLPVTGAFHSPLMAQASEAFARILDETEFARPLFPVAPNASGRPTDDPDELRDLLKRQMTSPVLWTRTIEGLAAAGAESFVECWPKAYLGPLIRKTLGPAHKAQVSAAS